jgi:cobalt-zinc-cadmium efflux system membrane fusion protein
MRLRTLRQLAVTRYALCASASVAALVAALLLFGLPGGNNAAASDLPSARAGDTAPADSIDLTEAQLQRIHVQPVGQRVFTLEDDAIGNIDFNEDMESQVFPPYQGKIIALFAKVGDDVQQGQTLFTIDSPDLVQAESTLIGAAGVLKLTTRALDRAKDLYGVKGLAQKDYDQAVSDQQAAEGAYKAAEDAVRIFGKTPAEIEKVVATRKVDSSLVVTSPVSGRVTARSAAPGLFVQPGNTPAPFTVTDISRMWMLANVPESTIARYHNGQDVAVTVAAYPDKVFDAKIVTTGTTVDPNTRRVFLRSEVADPSHLLRSGMFATFTIKTGDSVTSVAVPLDGIVREGDGTMTAWVTTDRKRFTQRTVKLGLTQNGYHQVLDGLKPGEIIAADNALFLNNALAGVDEE